MTDTKADSQEITAAELAAASDNCLEDGMRTNARYLTRAARTIRRLEGEVATLKAADYEALQSSADAELGALVRRIREHPEGKRRCLVTRWSDEIGVPPTEVALTESGLRLMLSALDTLAQRRAAEEGERGPSGRRYRMRDGVLEHLSAGIWNPCPDVRVDDVTFVAELLERVRKGVPRGE